MLPVSNSTPGCAIVITFCHFLAIYIFDSFIIQVVWYVTMCVKMLSSIVTVVIIITQLLCTSLQQSLSHIFWQHWFYGHQLWLALLLQPSVYFTSCQQHYCSHHESLSLFFLNNTNIKSALFAYETRYKMTLFFIWDQNTQFVFFFFGEYGNNVQMCLHPSNEKMLILHTKMKKQKYLICISYAISSLLGICTENQHLNCFTAGVNKIYFI